MNDPEIIHLIDQQLAAYNLKDFETFAACYDPNICSYEFESAKLLPEMCGENFFNYYKKKFQENPKIHCEVTHRLVHDNLVVDQEIISEYQNSSHEELVVYQVQNKLITKMWFSKTILRKP